MKKKKSTAKRQIQLHQSRTTEAKGNKPATSVSAKTVWTKSLFLMIGIMVLYNIYAILFAEKIPVHNGLGWDGELYGTIIKNFDDFISNKQLQQYRIGRTLPLIIIYYSMQVLNIQLTDQNIILQFQILDAVLIIVSVVLWNKIANRLNLSELSRWLGFVALFINFANLKNAFYYPVGTDSFTFFLGLLLLLFFLNKNSIGILILSFLGAFVSPTMIFFGLLLFLFKFQEIKIETVKYKLNHILSAFLCLIILGGIIYSTFIVRIPLSSESVEPIHSLIPVSILSLLVFLYLLFSRLFNNDNVFSFLKIFKSVVVYKLILAVITYLLVQYIIQNLGQPNTEAHKSSVYLESIMKLSIAKPFIGIISFVVWFGPAIILTLMNWKEFTREIHRYGYGLFFFILGFLFLFLDTESRHIILIYPFLCAFTFKAIDRQQISKYFIITFVVLSLLFSKVWVSINPIPEESGNLWEFPMQKYFMNSGPWMSNQAYAIQGIVVLFSFIILFYFYYFLNKSTKLIRS